MSFKNLKSKLRGMLCRHTVVCNILIKLCLPKLQCDTICFTTENFDAIICNRNLKNFLLQFFTTTFITHSCVFLSVNHNFPTFFTLLLYRGYPIPQKKKMLKTKLVWSGLESLSQTSDGSLAQLIRNPYAICHQFSLKSRARATARYLPSRPFRAHNCPTFPRKPFWFVG